MAAPVNANINILVNTQQAMGQLRALQAQVAATQKGISTATGAAAAQQAALANAFRDSANASRMWNARIIPMSTAVDQFTTSLDKGKMSLGEYTRFAASQLPGMSRVFKREFELMDRVAEQNVRKMQTQFVALGNSATGAAQAMALTPTALDRQAASTAIATQRQMMMNRMIDLGTTKLLNWGKNTQWAGRQLMVGFSIPLAMMGAAAAKAFKEIDQSSIAFRRVYGDLQTTTAEMEKNLDAVKELGMEYTKYGQSLSETIDLAAKVAATGAENETLMAATEQTIRLATLGMMEYGEAMDATVALQTAFQVSNEDLASTIDFLNVVENQTVLSMQDMAAAIPRVAPVIKGLGGDVKDLAIFMTAMREGGISAEQGANALKSGLGRLINPTKAAREEAEKYGISINAIVQRNRGDILGTVTEFGKALSSLGELEQQQVLQKVFGTYQYARLGALFKNIANDAGQAQRTIELTGMSVEDLAQISERELGKIEEATSVKFQASIEKLKVAIAPIGETFMKALMPVIDFASKILNAFNDLPDGVKNAIAIATAAIAGIGPIVLMTVGLIANGIANVGKLMQTMRKFFARLRGDASSFDYLTQQEIEAVTAANALGGATDQLTGKFLGQRKALDSLIGMLGRYSSALSSAAAAAPLAFGGGARKTPSGTVVSGAAGGRSTVTGPGGIRMAKGGVVPGTGNRDTVPAMLTPGESVVTKEATQKYGPMIQAMNAGIKIPGFDGGVLGVSSPSAPSGSYITGSAKPLSPIAVMQPGTGGNQSIVGVSKKEFASEIGGASFAAAGKAAVDFATRMQTMARYSEKALAAFDPLDDLFNDMHKEITSQLKTSKTIDEAITKAKPQVDKILSDYIKQKAINGQITAAEGKRLRIAIRLLMGEQSTIAKVGGLARAERVDVREGVATRRRTQTVQLSGATGAPLATYRRMPEITRREFERRGLQEPSSFSQYERAHLRSVGKVPYQTGMVSARVQGRGLSPQDKQQIERIARQESQTRDRIVHQETQDIAVLSRHNRNSPHPIIKKDAIDDAKMYANTVKQTIMSMAPIQPSPGLLPAAQTAKEQYKMSQSATRREAYSIREMQRIGMTDAQIIRQLDRLKSSKEKQARAQELEAKAAERNARLAQTNANLAQQSSSQMAVEEQARKRGLRTRVSEYFATPVGDGTQTRGQALRSRIGRSSGAASMGLMGLTMAASMAGGSIGEMAQKIMPATMALTGIQMVAPMLTSKLGIAVLAITALVGSFVWMRKTLDEAAKSAAKLAASQGAAANRMETTSEALQYEFAAQRVDDRRFRFSEKDVKAQSEFSAYFESEGGQKFIQDLKDLTSEERYAKIASQISFAIADGLDPQRAKAFAQGIAAQIGDSLLNSKIAALFASGQLRSGSSAMIDLIAQRQAATVNQPIFSADLRAGLSGAERAGRFATNPVTESVNFLTRGLADLAGTADTTTDVLGKAAATVGTVTAAATAVGAAFFGIGAPIGAVIGTIAGLAMAVPVAVEEIGQLEKNSRSVAASFSSTIQILKEVDNAEALLLEERRRGIITAQEYAEEEARLNSIKNKQAKILGDAIEALVDQGANEQAIIDQLVLANFDEATAGAIARATDRDQLAAQLFGGKTYEEIGTEGQNFVNTVITDVLTGITPENAQSRIAEIGTIYKDIAQSIIDGAIEGMTLGNVDLAALQGVSEEKRYALGIESLLPANLKEEEEGGFQRSLNPVQIAADTAKNIMGLRDTFLELETSGQEVFNALASFGDPQLIARIGRSKDELTKLATAITVLDEYREIDIEFIMKNNIDPEEVAKSLDEMKQTVFKEEGFFDANNLLPDPQAFANAMMEIGKNVKDIPKFYKDAAKQTDAIIEKLGKDIFTKIGTIKPKILPEVLVELFNTNINEATQISNVLNDAFPNSLTDIQLSIALAFSGDPQAIALLKNPRALAAAKAGRPTFEEPVQGPFPAGTERPTVTLQVPSWLSLFANVGGEGRGNTFTEDDPSGSSGAAKEDPLKDLQTAIDERLALYSNITKLAGKLEGKKKDLQKALAALRYEDSFVYQLRDLGLSEQFIAELLSKGYKNAKEIFKRLGNAGLQRLNLQDLISRGKETTSEAVGAATVARKQALAANELRARGVNQDVIESIAGDPEKAEELLGYVNLVKKGVQGSKGAMWEFINAQKDSVNAAKEQEAAIEGINPAIQQAIDAQKQYFDKQMANFDQQYSNIEMLAHQEFKARTGMTVEGMELEIKKNEDLIDGHKERIQVINDEIRVIETRQGKASDYSDFGLEQLQKEIASNNENIRSLERTNELTQRRIDVLKRQDEIRNRESESLQRDLDKLSEAEQQIRDAYQKRIDALDKVAEVNNQIIEQQRQQLGLARALSEGDIYAATAAAQEMRKSQAEFAQQQARAGIEQGMEGAIAALTTAGGLTREQAEAQIANIKEQSYQTSLSIRALEDEIYNRQVNEILPLKDKEYSLNIALEKVQNSIAAKQIEIRDIERSKIEPLDRQNAIYKEQIEDLLLDIQIEQSKITDKAGLTRAELERQNSWILAGLTNMELMNTETQSAEEAARSLAAQWQNVGAQINNAKKALNDRYEKIALEPLSEKFTEKDRQARREAAYADYVAEVTKWLGTIPNVNPQDFINKFGGGLIESYGMGGKVRKYPMGGLIPYSNGGKVFGTGSRDSVKAMLTPGEFVVRKSMVDKYGIPMLSALNQGSFMLPRYNTDQVPTGDVSVKAQNTSNILAPMYNNYSVNVSVGNSNASADEIANRTIMKIKQMQDVQIRSNRGY